MRQGESEDGRGQGAGSPQPNRRVAWLRRRRPLLMRGAVCAAIVAFAAVVPLCGSWRAGQHDAIAEVASRATPEVAALLREANQIARDLRERFPNSPDALHVTASLHLRFGRAEEAMAYWEQCLELDPGFGPAYERIGSIASNNGDYAKAAECFRKAVELDPGSSVLRADLAKVLMDMGELEEAVGVLEEDLEAHPQAMPSHALLGQVYVQLKEYEKARQHLEAAIAMGPGYTNAYYGLVTACAKLGDAEKSREYLEKFKALKARDEQAHRDELKSLDDVAHTREGVVDVCTAAAKAYLAHGDTQTAEAYLFKATQLLPKHVPSHQVLAWLYERQGRTAEALQTLTELGEMAPQDARTQLTSGSLYARMGRFDEAEKAYRRVIELTPHQGGAYAELAKLYLEAGRKLPDAKALALKAASLEPVGRYFLLLSMTCRANGDQAGARSAIRRAVALEPENVEYQRVRELVLESN